MIVCTRLNLEAFPEKNIDNVRRAVKDLQIDYPVAVDNDDAVWRAFNNEYWPAHYFCRRPGTHSLPSFWRGRLRRLG